jgi:hypothetical protein
MRKRAQSYRQPPHQSHGSSPGRKTAKKTHDNSLFGPVVDRYSDKQAVADGNLFDIDTIIKPTDRPFFLKYATTSLLSKGYYKEGSNKELNVPNFRDLLNQTIQIWRKKAPGETFASGRIELPNGEKQKVFVAQNETGRYTVMAAEDY